MQAKHLGIIGAIAIGIAVAGSMAAFSSDLNQDIQNLDEYAMSADALDVSINANQLFVVDIRNQDAYAEGHIPGSSIDYLYGETLDKRINTIQNRLSDFTSTVKIVLIDDDGSVAKEIAQSMTQDGIETYYLHDGIASWNQELTSTDIPPTIDSEQLWAQLEQNEDIYLLDVRQPEELEKTQISSSINIPLAEIFTEQIKQIPADKPVVVICGSGNRATIATYALALEGVNFQVLDGGIIAWNKFLDENNLESI